MPGFKLREENKQPMPNSTCKVPVFCPACGAATIDREALRPEPMEATYHKKTTYDGFLFWKRNIKVREYLRMCCPWCDYAWEQEIHPNA